MKGESVATEKGTERHVDNFVADFECIEITKNTHLENRCFRYKILQAAVFVTCLKNFAHVQLL